MESGYAIRGGVFLEGSARANEVAIAGGSVGWLAAPGFPAKTAPKREKSRILGFRIVVE